MIFLHGLLGHAHQWHPIVEDLAGHYHVFAPQLPFLELLDGPTDVIPIFACYVRELMSWRGLKSAIVEGNSLGGHIALEMAISFPDAVEGLILTGSSGLMERGFDQGVPVHPGRGYLREKIREIFFDERFVTEELVDRTVALVSDRPRIIKVVRIARAAKRDNIAKRLREVRYPTLLVWGSDDRITPPEVAFELRSRIGGAELHVLERCGHVPMVERPVAFSRIVRGFLEANYPDALASRRRGGDVDAFTWNGAVR